MIWLFSSPTTFGKTGGAMLPSGFHRLMPFLVGLFWGTWTVCGQAQENTTKRITAGPFSVSVPTSWIEGAIVEKIPLQPVYSPDLWKEYRAAEWKRKILPREPSLALKPGYVNRPEHWAIRLPRLVLPGQSFVPQDAGDDATAPQILIHKATDWAGVGKDGKFDEQAARETIKNLRRMVENRDPKESPVFMDAELDFIVGKKVIRFVGGRGFRVLAQWSIEPNLVRKGELHYLFLGLSDDGSCQIVATFPVDLPGLPDGSEHEHLGFSTAQYGQFERQYSTYERAAKKWLLKNISQMSPSLSELDTMMSSLDIRKWQ